ncbi:MAG: BatD family protein [Thiolinea sp.]
MIKRLLYLCCLLWLGVASQVLAANITVLPDRNPVNAGEEFTLVFSSDEQPSGNPDFSPLDKDFEVLSTSTSSNVQIINGVVSREISWRLQVFPKSVGILTVPPIRFGNDESQPLKVVVSDNGGAAGGQQNGIIVELENNTKDPYVQQQIIVTQRLMHSVSLRQSGATMSHPRIAEGKGLIQQLGGITNKTMLRDGIQYKVSERRYAVFPQTSGKLILGRTVFQGILDDGTKRRDFFGMSGHQVRRYSAPLELDVREQPSKSGKTWLPAKSLSVNAHWQVPPDQLKTGEPVTLTLAIIADGLLAEQLPELEVLPPKGVKAYSNQPEFVNNSDGDTVVATRQDKWILIGTAPGEYKLPQIALNWWNLESGKLEQATVPPTQITVTGVVSNNNQPEPKESEVEAVEPPEPNADAEGTAGEEGQDPEKLITTEGQDEIPDATQRSAAEKPPFSSVWLWLAGLIAFGLVGLAIWLRRRMNRTAVVKTNPRFQKKNRINSLDLLQKACANNEPQKAYDALSDWVKQDLQLTPATLSQLRKEADYPLKQALDNLSMALYSSQHDDWQGNDLWQAVSQHVRPVQTDNRQPSGLVSLYPE